jgi:hypothetical protein
VIGHDDRAGGREHAAHAMADRDFGPRIWAGAVPRIWRTLSCNALIRFGTEQVSLQAATCSACFIRLRSGIAISTKSEPSAIVGFGFRESTLRL